MRFTASLTAAMIFIGPVFAAAQSRDERLNALVIVASDTAASSRSFRKYLSGNGARMTHFYPPHAFLGYVPPELDGVLAIDYGATVYRSAVTAAAFSPYGENALLAASIWNKRFSQALAAPRAENPGERRLSRKGEDIALTWSEVADAAAYRLQISTDRDFRSMTLNTLSEKNYFEVCPAFLAEGTYYWRVAGLTAKDGGESQYSEIYSFSVSKPARAPRAPMPAPARIPDTRLKGGVLGWAPDPSLRRYRLQISSTSDFTSPLVDVFTEKEGYKLSSLPLKRGTTYYMRMMGSDGSVPGNWSGASQLLIEDPPPIINDVRRPARRR